MKKYRVANGRSLDTKAGLIRGGGLVREIDLLASVEVLLKRRLIVDETNIQSSKADNSMIVKQGI